MAIVSSSSRSAIAHYGGIDEAQREIGVLHHELVCTTVVLVVEVGDLHRSVQDAFEEHLHGSGISSA